MVSGSLLIRPDDRERTRNDSRSFVVTQARRWSHVMPRGRRKNAVVRRDPPTRSPDGARPWDKLVNPDPQMHYVVTDNIFASVDQYKAMGYTPVIRTEGGVRPLMNIGENGGAHVMMGPGPGLLMQIPLGNPRDPQEGTKAWLDAPGQTHVDEIENRIVKKRGGYDGLRGIEGYTEISNQSSRPRTVEVRHG